MINIYIAKMAFKDKFFLMFFAQIYEKMRKGNFWSKLHMDSKCMLMQSTAQFLKSLPTQAHGSHP